MKKLPRTQSVIKGNQIFVKIIIYKKKQKLYIYILYITYSTNTKKSIDQRFFNENKYLAHNPSQKKIGYTQPTYYIFSTGTIHNNFEQPNRSGEIFEPQLIRNIRIRLAEHRGNFSDRELEHLPLEDQSPMNFQVIRSPSTTTESEPILFTIADKRF